MSFHGRLTLRNYRCFDWKNPAVLEFGCGFTALVGLNNSGKSSALRSVFELRNVFREIFVIANPSEGGRDLYFMPNGVSDVYEIPNYKDSSKIELKIEVADKSFSLNNGNELVVSILVECEIQGCVVLKGFNTVDFYGVTRSYDETRVKLARKSNGKSLIQYQSDGKVCDFSRVFDFCDDLFKTRYFPAFRNAINEGAGTYYDIPVGTQLVSTWDQWKAGSSKKHKLAISRVEKEIADLLGFRTLEINADKEGRTLDVSINGQPHKLYEVGSGVAQLIIVLAAALVESPPYILIDEPELSLHPALQLKFISSLAAYAKKGLLFSTHSLGLARSTAERVMAVHKIEEGVSSMSPFSGRRNNYLEWLGELSYSTRVDFGCEGLILVEGASEIMVFQELLRKYGKDQKYVLMQMGGSSLINGGTSQALSEITRLVDPGKVWILIDSEKKSDDDPISKDRIDFLSNCNELGMNAFSLSRRATENYFSDSAVKSIFGSSYAALDEYQKLSDSERAWAKADNWKIAREMTFEDIDQTDLGGFLRRL